MIVYLWTEDWTYCIPAILGDSFGDFLSARKKPKKLQRKKKITPCTPSEAPHSE